MQFVEGGTANVKGGDHVTMIGNARAGIGYRNEFQAENYGLLTNQVLFV